MAAPAMKTLRVSLVDFEMTPAGPGHTLTGEVWAKLTKQVRTTDGQVVVLAAPRRVIDATGIANFQVPANDDAGIAADDRGFGVVVGWDLTSTGAHGSTVNTYNTGTTVLVTTASPSITLFASLVPAVPGTALGPEGVAAAAAAASAAASAASAAASAALVGAPADTAVAALMANPASATRGVANSTYALKGEGGSTTDASLLTTGTLADGRLPVGSNAAAVAGKLAAASNLYDLPDPVQARTSLGLGLAATKGVGTTSADVAAGNDSRFGTAGILTPALIVETATGVWSGDAIARAAGTYPIIFSGTSDPADLVNGINTPANLAGGDIWLEKI